MEKPSYHESVNKIYEEIEGEIKTTKDRFEEQEKTRCRFCANGIRCNICSNGPCRITEKSQRGVCGIDRDAMVMRNWLRINTMGASAYTYHAKTTAKTLKETAKGNTPFNIQNESKLFELAQRFDIEANDKEETAKKLANRDSEEISVVLDEFAPEERKQTWKDLDILPGGPLHELMNVNTSVMTNVDSDYQSMAFKGLRMGLSTVYASLSLLEDIQDILFGSASPHEAKVDLGILNEDYVNILPNGHEPFMGAALIDVARRDEIQEKAKEAGAKGVRIIGSIESGQELMQRFETDDVFVGLTGNWLSNEYVLATGAVDVMAADMNCTIPKSGMIAEKYNSKIIPVTDLVDLPKSENKIVYEPTKAKEQAEKIIEIAIDNYQERKGQETNVPDIQQEIMTGFSTESVLEALGGSLDPLVNQITEGNIKGIVALVSCTTLSNGPQDQTTIEVAEELIKRNILVLSAGCGNAALQVGGLTKLEAKKKAGNSLAKVCEELGVPPVLSFGTCTDTGRLLNLVSAVADEIDVDPTQLPVAVTAPEYMEQKATIAAMGAVAYGLYTHVSPTPPITGSENVVDLFTDKVEEFTGGKVAVGDEPEKIVDDIENHINEKREELGI